MEVDSDSFSSSWLSSQSDSFTSSWLSSQSSSFTENDSDSESDGDVVDPSNAKDPSVTTEPAGFHQPLYDGARLSTLESYLLIMNYALRHGLTKQAMSDLLNLVSQHLPSSSMVSAHKLKKFFLDMYEDISFKTHHCCSICHSPCEDSKGTCRNGCGGEAFQFLTISVEAQLKRKLKGKFDFIDFGLLKF